MPNIDEKVVQMTFDNKQFEKGVAQSLKSLEDLKKALELDKMSNSLKNLEKVTTSMSDHFGTLENSVRRVAGIFTPLGNLGYNALNKISNAALDAATKFMKMATGMQALDDGANKYEKYTKSVQVITNATGKSIDEVSKVLDKLMKYTDETSYDFAEMSASIGKFTSVGIDLERAEAAMEGIANWAAKSGAGKAEANRAMYNISQAMGVGAMKKIDWNSITNANMATKEFKELAIQTAEELGVISKESGITYQNFAETLEKGWLTTEVMTAILEKYADTSTDFGKKAFKAAQEALTFTDAIDAMKDAMSSGWLTSFKYLFGNLDEARVMWTDFANALIEFSDVFTSARNELLEGWHKLGGYTTMIEGVSNAWQAFMNIVYGVRDALASMLPPDLPNRLVQITEQFRDITAGWKETFGIDTELEVTKEVDVMVDKAAALNKELERGAKNDYVRQLQEQLIKAGYLKDKSGADGIYGSHTQEAVRKLQKALGVDVTGAWDTATRAAAIAQKKFIETEKREHTQTLHNVEEVTELQEKQIDHSEELTKVLAQGARGTEVAKLQEQLVRLGYLTDKSGADGIYGHYTQDAVRKLQKDLGVDVTGAWDDATMAAVKAKKAMVEVTQEETTIYKKTTGLTNSMKNIQDFVKAIGSGVKLLGRVVASGLKIIGGVLEMFKPLVQVGITVIGMFGDMFRQFAIGVEQGDAISNTTERILNFFKPLGDAILIVSNRINEFVKGYYDFLHAGRKENTFTNFFEYLSSYFKNNKLVQSFVFLYNAIKAVVFNIVAVVVNAFSKIFSGGDDKSKGNKVKRNPIIVFLEKILNAVTILANGLAIAVLLVAHLLGTLFSFVAQYVGPIGKGIGNMFGEIMNKFKGGQIKSFSDFFTAFGESFAKTKPGQFFTSISDSIKGFYDSAKTYLSGRFPAIFDYFAKKWESLKNFVTFDSSKGFFDNLRTKFEEIKMAVANAIDGIKAKLVEFKNYIVWLFEKDESGKLNLFNELGNALSLLQPFIEKLVDFKDRIVAAITEIFASLKGDGGAEGKGSANSVLGNVVSFLKDLVSIDFGKYLLPAIGGLLVYGLFKNFKAIRNFTEGLAGLISGNVKKKDSFGDTALKIAGSIAAVSLAVGLLSLIDTNKAKAGVTALIVVLAAFTAASYAFSKMNDTGKDAGKQVLMLASSVAVLAGGLWLLMEILKGAFSGDKGNLGAFVGSVTLIIGAIVGLYFVEKKLKEANGTKADVSGVYEMCKGVVALVLALGGMIHIIKGNDLPTIGKALGILAVILAALFGIEYAMAHGIGKNKDTKKTTDAVNHKVSGVLQMCLGMQFLVAAFGTLVGIVKKSKWQDLLWATGIITGMLAAVGIIANAISSTSSTLGAIGKGAVLAGAILAFSFAIKTIAEGMASAIASIQGIDPWAIATFFGGMTALLVGASVAIGLLSAIPLTALLKGAIGLLAVVGVLALAVALFSAIGTEALDSFGKGLGIIGSGIQQFAISTEGINFEAVAAVFPFIVNNVKDFLTELVAMNLQIGTAIEVTENLKTIGAKIEIFGRSMASINEDMVAGANNAKTLVTSAQDIATAMNAISLAKGVEETLTSVGSALDLYYTSISGIGKGTETGETAIPTVDSQMISEAFTALKDAIPVDDISTLQSYAEGGSNDMNKVALGIVAIGNAIESYGTSIGTLDEGQVASANTILTTIAGLYTTIGETDNLTKVWHIFGNSTTDQVKNFSDILVEVGNGIGSYIDSIKGADKEKITLANNTIDFLANINNKLPKEGFFVNLFTGKKSLGAFGTNMGALGAGVKAYCDNLSGATFDNVQDSLDAVSTLADISGKLEKSGGLNGLISGEKNLSLLGNGLADLGTDISTFATNVGSFEYKQVEGSLQLIDKLVGVFGSLGDLEHFDPMTGKTTNKLTAFGQGLTGMIREISGLYSETIKIGEEGGGLFGIGSTNIMFPVLDAMSQVGASMVDGLVSGIDSSNGGEDGSNKVKAAFMRTIIDSMSAIRKIEPVYFDTGVFIIEGLINGINDRYQTVVNMLDQLGKDSAEALQKATEVHSPSDLFYWIAEMWIKGLTNALEDHTSDPIAALTSVKDYILESFKGVEPKGVFETLAEGASWAADVYQKAAEKIVGSNDKVGKSNASGIVDGAKPTKASYDPVKGITAGYYSKLMTDPEFSKREKEIENLRKEIVAIYPDSFALKRGSIVNLDPNTKNMSQKWARMRTLQLEQYGYLDPDRYAKGSAIPTQKMFEEAYNKFLHDTNMVGEDYKFKYDTNFLFNEINLIEKKIKEAGGLSALIEARDRTDALKNRGWVLNAEDFSSQYGADYKKIMDQYANPDNFIAGLFGGNNGLTSFASGLSDSFGSIFTSGGGFDTSAQDAFSGLFASGGGFDISAQNAFSGLFGEGSNIFNLLSGAFTGGNPASSTIREVTNGDNVIGSLSSMFTSGESNIDLSPLLSIEEVSKVSLGNIDNAITAVNSKMDTATRKLDTLLGYVSSGFDMVRNKNGNVYINGDALVGQIGSRMSRYLGAEASRISRLK